MEKIISQTARLNLRSVEPGDELIIFPEVDEELTKYWIGWEPPKDVEEVRQSIEKSLALSKTTVNVDWMAFDKAGGFVGKCGIVPHMFPNEFEIDLWVKRERQGQGFAKEMLNALIDWARQNLKLPYIVYSVTEGNIPSEAIVKKLGIPLFREYAVSKRRELKLVRDYKVIL